MGLFIAIGFGLLIGAIGAYLVHDEYDSLVLNLLAGIVGSVLGLGFYFLLHFGQDDLSYAEGRAFVCEILGAMITVASFALLQRLTARDFTD